MKPTFLHPEATQHLIWFNHPATLAHWSLPFLEAVVILCALIALWHGWQRRRAGDPTPLAVWASAVAYGVILEIIVYNTVDNFWHAEFTVMLYHNRLPLYIMALYPAVLCPVWSLARGVGLTAAGGLRQALQPALACAFAGQALYAGFDNLGPRLGWWTWDTTHATLQPFWGTVPATSYLWMWTLCLCTPLVARWMLLRPQADGPRPLWWWALRVLGCALAMNVCVVGVQTPVTLVSLAAGQPLLGGALIFGLSAWSAAVCVKQVRHAVPSAEGPWRGPLLWCGWHGGLYVWLLAAQGWNGRADAALAQLLLGLGWVLAAWVLLVRGPLQAGRAAASATP